VTAFAGLRRLAVAGFNRSVTGPGLPAPLLPATQLATEYGVSNTTAAHAVRVLTAEGT